MTITINGSGTITGASTLATTVASPTFTTPNIDSAQFATVSGTAPLYAARAWVNFNGTGTVAIRGSGNVSSLTDNGAGDYTVNFTTALTDVNYGVSFAAGPGNGRTPMISTASFNDTSNTAASLMSTTQLRVIMSNSAASYNDTSFFCVSIFR